MSPLRKQLESAKAEYDALRYPGDLAIQTLRQLHRPRRWMWIGATSLSALAAALIATLLWMQRPPTQVNPSVAAAPDGQWPTTSNTRFTISTVERPAWPERPDFRGAFPSRQGISLPSVPSIPSWDALKQSSLSNEQESV